MEPPKAKHTPIIIFSGYSVYVLWHVGLSIGGLELSRILKEISMLYETISAYTKRSLRIQTIQCTPTLGIRVSSSQSIPDSDKTVTIQPTFLHPAHSPHPAHSSPSSSLFSFQPTLYHLVNSIYHPTNSIPSSQLFSVQPNLCHPFMTWAG